MTCTCYCSDGFEGNLVDVDCTVDNCVLVFPGNCNLADGVTAEFSDGDLTVGAIVGIVIAIIIVLMLLILCCCLCRRRRADPEPKVVAMTAVPVYGQPAAAPVNYGQPAAPGTYGQPAAPVNYDPSTGQYPMAYPAAASTETSPPAYEPSYGVQDSMQKETA
eukprot:Clim_evm4s6 gene=Clim_evmTU4s6